MINIPRTILKILFAKIFEKSPSSRGGGGGGGDGDAGVAGGGGGV